MKQEYLTVTMHINTKKFPCINSKWDINFQRDIIQHIECPRFQFSSSSMNVAITKVGDLIARHPENFFNKVIIE